MSDKLKKYTHKEINTYAIEARNAAGLIHTLDEIRKQNPINTNLRKDASVDRKEYNRFTNYDLVEFIDYLVQQQTKGATHITFEWSTGEWADDDPMEILTDKMTGETLQAWMDRVIQARDRILDNAYGAKQRELLAHNEKIDTYLRLKRELGD